MERSRPGGLTTVLGTLAAVAGALVVPVEFNRDDTGRVIWLGGLLVLAGLLLRIEGAIPAGRDEAGLPPMTPVPRDEDPTTR